MGKQLTLLNWRLFHQVCENMNGIIGIGEDVGNADPFYVSDGNARAEQSDAPRNAARRGAAQATAKRLAAYAPQQTPQPSPPPPPRATQHWGALSGFLSFLERGLY